MTFLEKVCNFILSVINAAIMKKKVFTLLAVALCSFHIVCGQDGLSVRGTSGAVSGRKPVDGFHFSLEFGIPLNRWLELSPSFTCLSTMPWGYKDLDWSQQYGTGIMYGNRPPGESSSGDIMGSADLLLILRPVRIFSRTAKHDIGIGFGYGIKAYAITMQNS